MGNVHGVFVFPGSVMVFLWLGVASFVASRCSERHGTRLSGAVSANAALAPFAVQKSRQQRTVLQFWRLGESEPASVALGIKPRQVSGLETQFDRTGWFVRPGGMKG